MRPPQSGGGSAQTPSTHSSLGALQQSELTAQAWPDSEQVGPDVGDLQTPLVAPGAMSQESPLQQSAFTVQLAVSPWHGGAGGLHTPPEQLPEQQSVFPVQPPPVMTH